MAKLSDKKIQDEVNLKGFELVDSKEYRNIKSDIIVKCGKNHLIETSLFAIRKDSFRCPVCDGNDIKINKTPPKKEGFRVVGLDNATQNMGISIFDDGVLVYYSLIRFTGSDFEKRLAKIFNTVNNIIIGEWDPDYIIYEDIQYQNNYQTYKKLAMLLGLLSVAAQNNNVEYDIVGPNTWRSHFQIVGNRSQVKNESMDLVKRMYNAVVSDDVAEAILIGKFGSDKTISKTLKKAF